MVLMGLTYADGRAKGRQDGGPTNNPEDPWPGGLLHFHGFFPGSVSTLGPANHARKKGQTQKHTMPKGGPFVRSPNSWFSTLLLLEPTTRNKWMCPQCNLLRLEQPPELFLLGTGLPSKPSSPRRPSKFVLPPPWAARATSKQRTLRHLFRRRRARNAFEALQSFDPRG